MPARKMHLAELSTGQMLRMVLALCLAATWLSACGSKDKLPTESGMEGVFTAAAQTLEVSLTETSRPPTPLPTPTGFSITPLPGPTSTPAPTSAITTVGPTITPGGGNCDGVGFIDDVSIPDGSEIEAGASFTKTWRLQNKGTCAWTTGYALVFASGERMGAPGALALPQNVAPEATIDISVTLNAPATSGTYRSEFKLRNANQAVFGIGESNDAFWVEIKVKGAPAAVAFDFVSQARQAVWASGQESGTGMALTFGGVDADPNGVAAIKDNILLENNAVSGKVLFTYPKHVANGYIAGVFPAFTVRSGDRFQARLGLAKNPTGECGTGKVTFQLGYQDGAAIKVLDEWTETCDGEMAQVEVDLSSLAGQNIQFIFAVRAVGNFQDAWAIWNSPHIGR